MILVLTLAIVEVDWVPEVSVVFVTSFGGLLLAIVLARRVVNWLPAWILIVAYGVVVSTLWLGRLAPPVDVLVGGWMPASDYIRQNWALLVDRAGGWLAAAVKGGRSEETIVFAFGLGLLVWLLAAYAGWATFRQRRPWAGLALLTLALAVNNHYGRAELWSLPLFVGLLVALVAVTGQADREATWTRRGVDYSGEIRLDLLFYSGAIALFLLFVATALPAINFRAISDAVLNRPAVEQTEQTLERLFAGVRQPAQDTMVGDVALVSGEGGGGVFPRAFLLGAPPEVTETIVMTATVEGNAIRAVHWRGLSYDVYTGRGWAVSAESRESVAAGQSIPLPRVVATTTVTQTVSRTDGSAVIRYTIGLPERFNRPVTTHWRGQDDLSRVEGRGESYGATSQVSAASAAELRGASLADVPPAVMARYTSLPDSVPERIFELAQHAAGQTATAYDQAKALEAFLRQYPYSLEVELPPAGRDPVDYFLFDLQAGYCDYYASAMVVMARSLGLPARLAGGYLAQPAVGGQQIIKQKNAHSWAEVYFAGYGWLEFEPTAAFPAESSPPPLPGEPGFLDSETIVETVAPSIPEPQADGSGYLWLLALVPLWLAGWWLWRAYQLRRAAPADPAAWAYQQLQFRARRLGQDVQLSQTPAEFSDAFLCYLKKLDRGRMVRQLQLTQIEPEVRSLTSTYARRQYARQKPPAEAAVAGWRRVRRQLWLLTLIEKLRDLWPFR
jgi:transglutaminase-like putative cysteine protease